MTRNPALVFETPIDFYYTKKTGAGQRLICFHKKTERQSLSTVPPCGNIIDFGFTVSYTECGLHSEYRSPPHRYPQTQPSTYWPDQADQIP